MEWKNSVSITTLFAKDSHRAMEDLSMKPHPGMDIPVEWERIDLAGLQGVLMVVGANDTGKSTFARYLFARLQDQEPAGQIAFLDGDPGQASLGPPTTLTVSARLPGDAGFVAGQGVRRYFIGDTSPRGHFLPMLVGAARLARAALDGGTGLLVYDTSGFIDPKAGALALKQAEMDLLQPAMVFALQHAQELEALLVPLRHARRARLAVVRPVPGINRRSPDERRRYRQERFRLYFRESARQEIDWSGLAVWPLPRFSLNRLVALDDQAGFTLGLGIVLEIDRPRHRITLLTPLESLERVSSLRLGELALDPQTFLDTKI
jgi:polynucleotide 5'-hydroxyl-kinase GRC3/NOL9